MSGPNDQVLKKLLAVFATEAEEHLSVMSSGLVSLEKQLPPEQRAQQVEEIFRAAHTLKGAARAVGLVQVANLCHALESVLAALKRSAILLSPALIGLLYQGADLVRESLSVDSGSAGSVHTQALQTLVGRLERAAVGTNFFPQGEVEASPPTQSQPAAKTGANAGSVDHQYEIEPAGAFDESAAKGDATVALRQTIRISVGKLDALLRQAEELISLKLSAAQHVTEIVTLASEFAAHRMRDHRHSTAVNRNNAKSGTHHRSPPQHAPEAGYHEREAFAARIAVMALSSRNDLRQLTKAVDSLLESAKQVMIVPCATLLEPFHQFVRESSMESGKEVEFVIRGEELEIDRRIQEALKDALVHLVRNAIDHGIESPEIRAGAGKPKRGKLSIVISQHESGRAEIAVSDDGTGIDITKVRRTSERLGLVPAEQANRLSDAEILALVFRSGFSTRQLVTDISGRGLGLAIVQEKVEKIGGSVSVSSIAGRSTNFKIDLPVALSSLRGVVVEVNRDLYILPTQYVERVARIARDELLMVQNQDMVKIDGKPMRLVWLANLLDLNPAPLAADGWLTLLVVTRAGQTIAFAVDAIQGEQEVLMKGLGPQLVLVRHIAGASILPTGALALVLSVRDLMVTALSATPIARQAETQVVVRQQNVVLVAEDSITARTLFRHVLEAVGYQVITAVDGMDAWGKLRAGGIDLVISDVEMPRLDGFGLTARIRADTALQELPVILITSLGSREDRERGVNVGASAYIVKDNFDQAHFLDLVSRLI